jgi:hypothetical protein
MGGNGRKWEETGGNERKREEMGGNGNRWEDIGRMALNRCRGRLG